ncbi:MAG: hypothetical protein QOG59_2034 [Solirubrobacteraceae bacterium]|jgi:hypothetical protein|nr:hypothetical protein [Solirubrobacteraceae bacterium]
MIDDAAAESEMARRLAAERPVPAAGFRGALGRQLEADDPGYGPRPARLRLAVAAWLGAGGAVGVVGALIALGAL